MKKLKIFLLLSILLSYGFILTSEVHAQGNGSKVLEIGDVLPAGEIKLSWDFTERDLPIGDGTIIVIRDANDGLFIRIDLSTEEFRLSIFTLGNSFYNLSDEVIITLETDLIVTSIPNGSDEYYEYIDGFIFWEVVPSGYSITFEENGGTSVTDLTEQTVLPSPLPTPTKENHIFRGWYYDSDFTNRAFPGDPLTDDVILYAKWGSGKIFEEGDVLPVGNIKISWDFTDKPTPGGAEVFTVTSSGDLIIQIFFGWSSNIEIDINYTNHFNGDTPSYTIITLTEPVTITDVAGNFNDYDVYIGDALLWEALPPEYLGDYDDLYTGELLDIEEDYILPQSKVGIKLLYNNTGGPKSGTITYTFGTYGQIILTAQEDNSSTQVTSAEITFNFLHPTSWENLIMIDDTFANQSFGSTRGILFAGVLLDFSLVPVEERTITDITVEGDLEIDAIFTRILTDEELAYQEGYSNGYQVAREIFGWKDGDDWYNGIDAWNLGEKYARELYGYYDSTTDEWLSVDDYVARYGTGNGTTPTGPSDFYNNFDKYFIPAMIIVFGGAIVLTILKVFKGRE
jgi:uncharacterized repeat protein (TIGR02543 family)